MEIIGTLESARLESWTDEQIVDRVKAGDTALYEIIMRRYNQRLYRVARAILRNDAEAEDVMQDAYVRAYQNLHQFAGNGPFSAWLTRIAVHEALRRLRLGQRNMQFEDTGRDGDILVNLPENSLDPEQSMSMAELGHLLEEAVLHLPEQYRTVVMLRDIEEMTTEETAAALDLTSENVKVRLHRARAMLRRWLFEQVGAKGKDVFPFMGARCDRVVKGVFSQLID